MTDTNYKDRLVLLRKSCGYTQKELAEIIGVSRVMYHRYENDGVIPRNKDVLNKLASTLEVTPKQLIFGNNLP